MEWAERFEPVRLEGRELAIRVVRSRNRNGYATVSDSGITISIPSGLPAPKSEEMASDLYKKIRTYVLKHPYRFVESRISFYDGKVTSPMGLDITIRKEASVCKSPSYKLENRTIVVRVPTNLDTEQEKELLGSTAIRALSSSMYGFVAGRVNRINRLSFNARIKGVRIHLFKNMWGSLSPDNTITINLKLLYAPPSVLDYVIVHELSHTVEMNHTKRFWRTVERAMPDYKEKRAWLKEHGPAIII